MTNRASFIQAATAAAFIAEDGRTLIHCFSGGMGADWDVESVVREIEVADDVQWGNHILGHDLIVTTGPRRRCFDVKRPEAQS